MGNRYELVDRILSDIMCRADVDDHVRWQNAIAEARLQFVRVDLKEPDEEKVVKVMIEGSSYVIMRNFVGTFEACKCRLHRASAAALYKAFESLAREKTKHLKPDTLAWIIAVIPEYDGGSQTSFLDLHGGDVHWLDMYTGHSGVATLRGLAADALIARLYDKYYRHEHLTVQNIPAE